jgi:hypothetical protein
MKVPRHPEDACGLEPRGELLPAAGMSLPRGIAGAPQEGSGTCLGGGDPPCGPGPTDSAVGFLAHRLRAGLAAAVGGESRVVRPRGWGS